MENSWKMRTVNKCEEHQDGCSVDHTQITPFRDFNIHLRGVTRTKTKAVPKEKHAVTSEVRKETSQHPSSWTGYKQTLSVKPVTATIWQRAPGPSPRGVSLVLVRTVMCRNAKAVTSC